MRQEERVLRGLARGQVKGGRDRSQREKALIEERGVNSGHSGHPHTKEVQSSMPCPRWTREGQRSWRGALAMCLKAASQSACPVDSRRGVGGGCREALGRSNV